MSSIPTDLSRRRFIEAFAKTLFGVNVLGFGACGFGRGSRRPQKAESVIYLYLRGGLSHIDTFDPKPGRPEMAGVQPIETSAPGVQISEWFPQLARQMHHVCAGALDDIDARRSRSRQLSGPHQLLPDADDRPSGARRLGAQAVGVGKSLAARQYPDQRQPAASRQRLHGVAPGAAADRRSGRRLAELRLEPRRRRGGFHAPHATREVRWAAAFSPARRIASVAAYDKIHAKAVELMKSNDLKAFDIAQESPKTQEAYGSHTFGQGCLLARRLVEHGVRFIEVEDDQNWDTHNDQLVSMQRMTPSADQALAALARRSSRSRSARLDARRDGHGVRSHAADQRSDRRTRASSGRVHLVGRGRRDERGIRVRQVRCRGRARRREPRQHARLQCDDRARDRASIWRRWNILLPDGRSPWPTTARSSAICSPRECDLGAADGGRQSSARINSSPEPVTSIFSGEVPRLPYLARICLSPGGSLGGGPRDHSHRVIGAWIVRNPHLVRAARH